MNLRPLHDRVIVERVQPPEVSKGGIIIPAQAQERPLEAIVKAVGPGKLLDSGRVVEPSVKTGDRVYLGRHAGTEIEIDGSKYLVVRQDDILAVVAGEAGTGA